MNRNSKRTRATRDVRKIGNVIRALHLNSSPTWHLVKSRAVDPPPYIEDVVYQRKVRLTFAATTPQGVKLSPSVILGAAGLPASSFEKLTVLRGDFYGVASATTPGIRITPEIITNDTTVTDREFDDFGVQGARRPHVRIVISPKDQAFIPTFETRSLFTFQFLDELGEAVSGTGAVVDLHCQFKNTATTTRLRRQDAMEYYRDIIQGLEPWCGYDSEDPYQQPDSTQCQWHEGSTGNGCGIRSESSKCESCRKVSLISN